MTPTTPVQDLATQWSFARKLYPVYFELAREFAIEVKPCAELEAGVETPGKEVVEQANQWVEHMDEAIQVHQLRQFLQTSSLVSQEGLLSLLQHFLAKTNKSDSIRDKIDFLLVQYFSQIAPAGLNDAEVDLAYVAQTMEPVLGQVELKPPVWLNALDRVLDAARKCKSLDELLHGGVLEQGRKAKGLAGELFYLPVALVAFTRFGYLMRRAFFRLMLGDLNLILDGLSELEDKGIDTIDCRRAQFSAQEPVVRLRMICQSWKVMFQAEYSSGSPLRMLVDLRASVEHALGRGKAAEADAKAKPAAAAKPALAAKPTAPAQPNASAPIAAKPAPPAKPAAAPAVKAAAASAMQKPVAKPVAPGASKPGKPVAPKADAAEFEVSSSPGWNTDSASRPPAKK
ncbi:MAG TPA: hypothetical protein VMS18_08225 [Candidatus Binatia bacterium]|nr:hypothetical protein [Candidatus Sulfotelmatobacter sp.]HXJ86786.1 hypothetical protein [Candidatus Binatia bacterium]